MRGVNVEKTNINIEKKIEELIEEKLGVGIEVKKAFEIKERNEKKSIVVTVEN